MSCLWLVVSSKPWSPGADGPCGLISAGRAADAVLSPLDAGSLFKTCLLYLPHSWWLSQGTEVLCYGNAQPASRATSASHTGWPQSPRICCLRCDQLEAHHRGLRGRTTPGRGVTLASASVTAEKEEKHAPSPQAAGEKRNHRGAQSHREHLPAPCTASSPPGHRHVKITLGGNLPSDVLWFAFT